MKTWTVPVEAVPDSDDVMITLPDDLLEMQGWKEGDTIEWIDNKDGSYTLVRKEQKAETEWVLVETVSLFRHRYVIEVPKGRAEWACDTVVCNEAKEFSQKHIDESIVSHRVITEREALDMCDEENGYCNTWTEQVKKQNFFNAWHEHDRSRSNSTTATDKDS
jgi:bifunctional DNA-binding transcriptional regulator/antitoxin component of YhaV-PrlF toxin-antitoxin module